MTNLEPYIQTIPLGPWLDLCEQAGVNCIPAIFSEPIEIREICGALDRQPSPNLDRAIKWSKDLINAGEHRQMVRWEQCCDGYKKYLAAYRYFDDAVAWTKVVIDDERLFDCAMSETTRLCVRPWVDFAMVDGYPLEFRIFFGPGGLEGVSSYYPQRGLPYVYRRYALRAQDAALKVYRKRNFPVGCTMDFGITEDDRIFFLEGGPAHWNGQPSAHPCCQEPGNIHGIALAPRVGALGH